MSPACPRCGGPTELRRARGGAPFWGCAAWPACRGLIDADERPEAERVRGTLQAAARLLARWGQRWCDDDRADALQQAATALVAAGRIAHPAAVRWLALRALQVLRGWRLVDGRPRSCRSPATPTATAPLRVDRDEVGPSEALDLLDFGPAYPSPESAVDLARRLEGAPRAEPPPLSRLARALAALDALPLGRRKRVCADLRTTIKELGAWARGERPVPRAKVDRVLAAAAREAGA